MKKGLYTDRQQGKERDTVTRVEKRPVTPEICASFERQKVNGRPRKITVNVHEIEFFDPNSGRARIWYSKAANGTYELFDSRGFNPATSGPLLPVTKAIVDDILARSAKKTHEEQTLPAGTESQSTGNPRGEAYDQAVIGEMLGAFKNNPACFHHSYLAPVVLSRSPTKPIGIFIIQMTIRYVGDRPTSDNPETGRLCGHGGWVFTKGQSGKVTVRGTYRWYDSGWRLETWKSGWVAADNTWHPAPE